jgi:hypothetical protein
LELQALAQGLILTRGAAPKWLGAELRTIASPRFEAKADPAAYRGHMAVALSVGGLLAAFLGCADADLRFISPETAVRAAAADPDGLDAIALVQDWKPSGDEKPVLRRLAGAVRNPAYPRAWSAEKTEDDSYLVLFREPAGYPVYAFEVNLESEAVQPTPEAVERLTMLRMAEATAQDALAARVRETTEAQDAFVARAR